MAINRTYLPALLLLAASVSFTGGLTAWPRDGEPMAAIYPPGDGGEAAFASVVAAGADAVLGTGALSTIVVVRSDDPGFVHKLYRSGAIMVVRAPAKGDCLR